MTTILRKQLGLFVILAMFFSCSDEDYTPIITSPVVVDSDTFPFNTLAEYNFFEGAIKDQKPELGVIPYEPISTLFTDYAKKKRFVWMPEGVKATYTADANIINFPVGTVLIKTFYYENVQPANNTRIIETRLMLKQEDDWVFADYIWNDEQTEATFSLEGSTTFVEFSENGELKSTNYRIPSQVECFTCHKNGTKAIPIGVKPQNLNSVYNYEDGSKNQLLKLIDEGYLENNLPNTIDTVVKWTDETQPLALRVRSYIDINCAHCHSELAHCDYRPVRFAFDESNDDTNIGVCVDPDTQIQGMINIVTPAIKERSVMYFRLNTTEEQYRMPILGRSIIHEEAVEMIGEWIDNLDIECE